MALERSPEPPGQGSFLPGRIAVVALYLFNLANVARVVDWFSNEPDQAGLFPWMLGAILTYFLLCSWFFWRPPRSPVVRALYFAFQATLVLGMLLIQRRLDFVTTQYTLLSYQASLHYSGKARWGWIAALLVLAGLPGLLSEDPVRELAKQLSTMAGIVVVAAYVAALQEEQAARRQNQILLAELQETHLRLQAYAGQVEELATLEERNRLAREIHDSVSQTLFSIQLNVRAARLFSQTAPAHLGAQLQILLTLSQSALAEMRAFIVQLHSKGEGS
jgi:signal transduction histidine kinase